LNNFACSINVDQMRCAIRANFLETFIIFYHSGWNSPTRPSNPSHTGTSDLQEIEIRVEFTPDRFVCLCQTFQINEHLIFRLLTQSLRCGDFEIAQILDRFDSRFSANYVPPPREGSLVFSLLHARYFPGRIIVVSSRVSVFVHDRGTGITYAPYSYDRNTGRRIGTALYRARSRECAWTGQPRMRR